jgi:hypothetical protein
LAQRPDAAQVASVLETAVGFASNVGTWDNLSPGEYNKDLRGPRAQEVYHKMLLGDTQVYAVATAIDAPIRGAGWRFEPASPSTFDKQVCDFVEDNLTNRMGVTLNEAMRIMLTAIMVGVAVQEMEFVQDGGDVILKQLYDRPPNVIQRFIYSGGQLDHIVQAGVDENMRYQIIPIPAERLFISSYEPRGSSIVGNGLCRVMYPSWFRKINLLRTMLVGLQLSLIGTPYIKVPPGTPQTTRDELLQAIQDRNVRDLMGMVIDNDIEAAILEGVRNAGDALGAIEFFNVEMTRAPLAHMINLGTQQHGSGDRSVSEDQTRTFIQRENTLADDLAANINRKLIPRICNANWPGLKIYPKIGHADLSILLRIQAVGAVLAQLAQVGMITPRPEVENVLLDMLGLPVMDGGAAPVVPPPAAGDKATPNRERLVLPSASDDHHHADFAEVDPGQLGDMFNQVRDEFQTAAGALLQKMIDHMATAAKEPLAKLAAQGPLARARVVPIVQQLQLPGVGAYKQAVNAFLTRLVEAGFAAADQVQPGSAPASWPANLRARINADRDLLVEQHLTDIRMAFCRQLLAGADANTPLDQMLSSAGQSARDKADVGFRTIFTEMTGLLCRDLPGALIDPAG